MRRHLAIGGILLIAVLCLALILNGQGWSKDNQKISKQAKKGGSAVTADNTQGKTDIRILSEGIDFEAKGSGGEEDRIEQVPIVLWGKTRPEALLSMRYTFGLQGKVTETHTFDKHPLDGKAKTFKEKIKAATDDYPIVYKVKMNNFMDKEETRALNAIEPMSVLTADINGDGVEELIIPKTFGDIDVYDKNKRLFSSPPWESVGPPKAFELLAISTHVAVFEDRDVVFMAYNRRLSDELPPAKRRVLEQDKISAIFQIDRKGIRQIVPYGPGINWTLRDVRAIGAINYPGSKDIDEIVILHEMGQADNEDTYLTRLKPDGQVIDKPRKFYSSYSEYGNTTFIFVPQSRQTIMDGAEGFYFITPEKPTNWARQVNMPFPFMGVMRADKGLIVIVRKDMDILAVDEESRFITRHAGGGLQRSADMKPIYTIKLESGLHRLSDVIAGKHVDRLEFLIVQDREPQMKDAGLTWEKDYWPAAQRFMKEEWIQELRDESQWYLMPENAEEEYLKKYGKKRSLPELKDVKEHFPEYYEKFMKKAENKFRGSVISALTQPLGGSKSVDSYFNKKVNYELHKDFYSFQRWCADLYIPDELVFTLMADFKPQAIIRTSGFYQDDTKLGERKTRMPISSYRRHSSFLNIITIGRQSGEPTNWLYIHHEGGIR